MPPATLNDETSLVLLRNNASSCTIQTLPPELLLQIFMKNTELDDPLHDRLHTARYSSQVCRLWREQLLAYPPVWGRLLHLKYYVRVLDVWREEMLSRIGDALLWITGDVNRYTSAFFFSILQKKWQNVQILHISFPLLPFLGYRNAMQPILYRDAPNLEKISLNADPLYKHSDEHWTQFPSESPSTLFNGVAPRLRHVRLYPWFNFDATAPWLSALHSIVLFTYHTVPIILSILKSTPLLRSIRIDGEFDEMPSVMDYTDLNTVPLLHLDSLELRGCPTYLASLLESIDLPSRRPGQLRRLSIGTCNHEHIELSTGTKLERVRCTVMERIQAYMDDFPPEYINLSENQLQGSRHTVFIRNTHPSRLSHKRSNSLSLKISLSGPLRPLILHLAASPSFSATQGLYVYPDVPVEPLLPLYKAFHSVTELSVEFGLCQLLDAVDQYSLFPSLCTLRCDVYSTLTAFSRLLDFVENRASIGSPLSTFYLREERFCDLPDDKKSRLYGIPGLVVELTQPRSLYDN
ncbi:hypothetical protein CPC08DRAFT_768390 [Agrocybe pediades]|nr:hypothetical protein CPC08DRAFT_768390 [Agrocybe pediades]